MEDERPLSFDHIDYRKGKVEIDGKEYDMTSCHFPTIDPDNPDKLSEEEEILIQKLHHSFMVCEKLHKAYQGYAAAWLYVRYLQQQPAFPCFLSAQRRWFIKKR